MTWPEDPPLDVRTQLYRRLGMAILENCPATRAARLARELRRELAHALRAVNVTPSQLAILACIGAAAEPIRPRDIGKTLSLSKSAVSRDVKLMFYKGHLEVDLAENLKDPALSLSSTGEDLLERGHQVCEALRASGSTDSAYQGTL